MGTTSHLATVPTLGRTRLNFAAAYAAKLPRVLAHGSTILDHNPLGISPLSAISCADNRYSLTFQDRVESLNPGNYATSTSSSPCTFVRAISVACAQLPRNATVTRPCVLLPVGS